MLSRPMSSPMRMAEAPSWPTMAVALQSSPNFRLVTLIQYTGTHVVTSPKPWLTRHPSRTVNTGSLLSPTVGTRLPPTLPFLRLFSGVDRIASGERESALSCPEAEVPTLCRRGVLPLPDAPSDGRLALDPSPERLSRDAAATQPISYSAVHWSPITATPPGRPTSRLAEGTRKRGFSSRSTGGARSSKAFFVRDSRRGRRWVVNLGVR